MCCTQSPLYSASDQLLNFFQLSLCPNSKQSQFSDLATGLDMPLISAFSGSQFEMMILQALLYKLFIPFLAVFRWSVSCWKLHLYFIMCLFISLSQIKFGLYYLFEFFPLCVFKWFLKLPACKDAKSHRLHLFDFSPLCICKCLFELEFINFGVK